jgi:hypothetical protein
MAIRSDKTYQDPKAVGSLSSILRLWQTLQSDTGTLRVNFTLSCWSESRATRVAGFLRRRMGCKGARVHHVAGGSRDTWHIHGSLHPMVNSLPELEEAWSWLRQSALSHQVTLLRITLKPGPA